MNWITLSLFSALTLGGYEISRKLSLRKIAPFQVLFLSALIAALFMLPRVFVLQPMGVELHGWVLFKALVISFSWSGEFLALKRIPLSIGMAVRSCGPLFTTAIAVFFFNEQPSPLQWTGIGLILSGYFLFMFLARFHKQHDELKYRWLLLMLGATLLGSCSGGIDRYLLKSTTISPAALLAWFSLYTPLILLIPALPSLLKTGSFFKTGTIRWSWGIPCISILLLISDLVYFGALSQKESSLAVVGALRRGSIIISAIGGGLFFGEKKMLSKAFAIVLVLAGLVLLKLCSG